MGKAKMGRGGKIIIWLRRSFLVFAILVIAVLIIAPRLTNLETVRKNIEETFTREIGGEIKYRQMELAYFPRPHVVIHKTEITIPESFTIKIHLLKIYPKIFPLLQGSFQAAIVKIDYADYFLKLPEFKAGEKKPEKLLAVDDIVKNLVNAVRSLPEFKLPQLNLKIKNGKVDLVDPFGAKYMLRELSAKYDRSSDKFEFSIACKSNLWQGIKIDGSLNPLDFKGQSQIRLSQLRPQKLWAYFSPHSPLQLIDAEANLNIDLKSEGSERITADVSGTIPVFELRHDTEKLSVKGSRVRGTVQIEGNRTTIALADLGFDDPKLSLSGAFSYEQTRKELEVSMKADQINVDRTREMALTLAGEIETIRDIFDVIRGGTVPWMTVRSHGKTFAELGMLDNIVIQGQMTRGKIFVPEARLNLENVEGDADISNGILHGKNLRARMGQSFGQEGKLDLGLKQGITPVYLKILVDADLSQLLPVLNRVVKDEAFLAELALIEDFKGSAKGILSLSDKTGSLSPQVEVSEVHLAAQYARLPHPIKIEGGYFFYEGSHVAFRNMDTIIGTSSIADLSSSIDWENAPSLRADFKTANFTLDELYPWLMSFNGIQENIQDVQSVQGTVTFQNLNVEGPLFRPQNWRPQTQGVVENAIVKLKKLQKPLHLTHGEFSWKGSRIIFTDFDATLGNSSVLQASGDINWGTQPKFKTQSGPAIFDLEDITPWLFSFGNFYDIFKKYEPLTGILAFQHMALSCPISAEAYRQLKLSADIKNLTINAKRLPGPLRLNKGQFSWQNTQLALNNIDAALGNSTISQLSADFNWGTASTLDVHSESMQLFAGEIYPWLLSFERLQPILREFSASDGILGLQDLNLNGPLHHPADWEYRLTCQMQHLVVTSEVFGAPVTVTNGTFEISNEMTSGAVENKIIVGPTNIAWEKNLLTMMGEIWASNRNVLLSLDVTADNIDWKQIKNILDYIEKKNTAPNKLKWDGFLQGSINVQSDKFNYDAYRVQPLQAKVSFDHDKVMIAVDKAVICNISFRGLVKIQAQTLEIYFVPTAADQELGSTLTCITDKKDLATGIYDLSGELMAKSTPEEFPRSLSGNVVFTAETGRIYRFGLLAKIFAILNVTEVYRGEIPDLTGVGFAYHSMKARAKLQGGKIIMEECAIDGASMGIACEGDIDIADKKMNLVVLVAPFKTVDRIVEKIPLISGILGGKLISIPFSAKGDLKDPQVRPLPPTAVGSGVLGILERTLKLPITIIQPLLSGGNNEKQK